MSMMMMMMMMMMIDRSHDELGRCTAHSVQMKIGQIRLYEVSDRNANQHRNSELPCTNLAFGVGQSGRYFSSLSASA